MFFPSLSPRQSEISDLVVSGKSTREIAAALCLSPRTVETHISAIFSKLGVSSRVELLALYFSERAPAASTATMTLAARTNLERQPAELIGREAAIADIMALLRDRRLVTIIGAGGIGKTRTARSIGQLLVESTSAGVWFVELAAVTHGGTVSKEFLRVLGVRPPAQEEANVDALIAHLERKSAVIIVDNCEHVIAEAAQVADRILRACLNVSLLATSREPLRIASEQTYRLPSLRVPMVQEMPQLDAAGGLQYSAIDLFCRRAREAHDRFALTDENVAVVADICRRLDGIALAIELAAARVKLLPVNALATKLDTHLRILTHGDRVALERHQTMRALIDWSYALLTPTEQRCFARLSIFSGGCTLTEAATLCSEPGADEMTVLDVLSSLVDKSLVVADVSSDEERYGLLQTTAQFAGEKLVESGEAALVADRHAQTYLVLAERLKAQYDTAPTPALDARRRREAGNWDAALSRTLERGGDVLLGQRLAIAARPLWFVTGESRWMQLACDRIDQRTPAAIVAELEFGVATVVAWSGKHEASLAACERAITAFRAIDDARGVARSQAFAGWVLTMLDRIDEAEPLLESALAAARADARAAWWAWTVPLQAASIICTKRGDVEGMRDASARVLSIYESVAANHYAANWRMTIAELEYEVGNVAEAYRLSVVTASALRDFGVLLPLMQSLNNVASYGIALERWDEALTAAREALELARSAQHDTQLAWALQHLAAAAILSHPHDTLFRGQVATIGHIVGFIDGSLLSLGLKRAEQNEQREYDRLTTALRETMTANELAMLTAFGATLTRDQAADAALGLFGDGAATRARSTLAG